MAVKNEEVVEAEEPQATEQKTEVNKEEVAVNKDGFVAGQQISQEDYFNFIAKQNNA
ncbi:MAG: hypothetical protein JHC33_01000 [Ignisphaera sp.]|nr:hypothetical protein [Ignisphaera sp.]